VLGLGPVSGLGSGSWLGLGSVVYCVKQDDGTYHEHLKYKMDKVKCRLLHCRVKQILQGAEVSHHNPKRSKANKANKGKKESAPSIHPVSGCS
jgi:hypothetical protein